MIFLSAGFAATAAFFAKMRNGNRNTKAKNRVTHKTILTSRKALRIIVRMATKRTLRPAQVAKLLGIARKNVQSRMSSLGVEPNEDGSYDAEAVAKIVAVTVDTTDDSENLAASIKREQLRRARLQSELLEIQIAKERGEVILTRDHKAILRQLQETCTRLIDLWIEMICAKRRDSGLEQDLHAARLDALRKLGLIDDETPRPT